MSLAKGSWTADYGGRNYKAVSSENLESHWFSHAPSHWTARTGDRMLMLGCCFRVMACTCAITALLGDAMSASFSFLCLENVWWSCKVEVLFFKWGLERCLSGPVSKGELCLFAWLDGYLRNSFLPEGNWGHFLCQGGLVLHFHRLWVCLSLTLSGT